MKKPKTRAFVQDLESGKRARIVIERIGEDRAGHKVSTFTELYVEFDPYNKAMLSKMI